MISLNISLLVFNLSKKLKISKPPFSKFIKSKRFITNSVLFPKAYLNIFSLFVAINTKIPIFIIGKSGCGKSLCVQLIYKAMRGKASKNYYFKIFPKLL